MAKMKVNIGTPSVPNWVVLDAKNADTVGGKLPSDFANASHTHAATQVTEDSTHRFTTDTEKATWNGKQDAIAAGTTAQYWRGDKSWQTLNNSAVGLGNVENKSSATIRSEITSANVTTALGFTPANSANLATVATSGSYTDLSNKPTIPTTLSALTDDTTHRVVSDTEKATWNAKSNFSGDYNDLINKPTIPTQPTALSQLTDDTTHRLVTDTEKSTWNGKQNVLSGDVTGHYHIADRYTHPTGDGNLHIPATSTTNNAKVLKAGATAGSVAWGSVNASEVTDDATHRFVTDTEKSTWNAKSNFSGSYTDLTNKPTIPTALSALTDDATHRLVTDTEKSTWNGKQNALSGDVTGHYHTADRYTHPTTDGSLHVPATSTTNNNKVLKAGATAGTFAWSSINASEVAEDTTHRFVTDTEKNTWNGKASGTHTHAGTDITSAVANATNASNSDTLDTHHSIEFGLYGTTTGSANTYAVTLSPAPTSYVEPMTVVIKINVDNTGASTINVNGLGAISIKRSNGNDVNAGQLKTGSVYTLRYNGTNFILQGEGGSGNATASDLLSGKTASTDAGDIVGTMVNNSGLEVAEATASRWTDGTGNLWIHPNVASYMDSVSSIKVVDSDFVAGNIKNGTEILGITGSYGSDANASASCILNAYTAYGSSGKITGTMANWIGQTLGTTYELVSSLIVHPSDPSQGLLTFNPAYSGYIQTNSSLLSINVLNLVPKYIANGVKVGHNSDPSKQMTGTYGSDATVNQNGLLETQTAYGTSGKVQGIMKYMAQRNDDGKGVGYSLAASIYSSENGTLYCKPKQGYHDGTNGWVMLVEPNWNPANWLSTISLFGRTGTMPRRSNNNAALAIDGTSTAGRIYFKAPDGYYNGSTDWVYSDDANFNPANWLSTKTIFGKTGTISDKSGQNVAASSTRVSGTNLVFKPPVGYYDGSVSEVYAGSTDWVASNILSGKTIFGVTGTCVGSPVTYGTSAVINGMFQNGNNVNTGMTSTDLAGTGGYRTILITGASNNNLTRRDYNSSNTLLSSTDIVVTAGEYWSKLQCFPDYFIIYACASGRMRKYDYNGNILAQTSGTLPYYSYIGASDPNTLNYGVTCMIVSGTNYNGMYDFTNMTQIVAGFNAQVSQTSSGSFATYLSDNLAIAGTGFTFDLFLKVGSTWQLGYGYGDSTSGTWGYMNNGAMRLVGLMRMYHYKV